MELKHMLLATLCLFALTQGAALDDTSEHRSRGQQYTNPLVNIVTQLLGMMENDVDTLDSRLDQLYEKVESDVDDLDSRLDQLSETVGSDVDTVDSRLDQLYETVGSDLDTLDSRLDQLNKKVGNNGDVLDSRLDLLNEKVENNGDVLDSRLNQLNEKVESNGDDMDLRLDQLQSSLAETTCPIKKSPTNCIDIHHQDPSSVSGVYTIYTSSGHAIEVYCDFYGTRGYMFLSKAALSKLDSLDGLYTITDYAVIRVLYTNGEQHEVLMSQMREYQFRFALSFQLSKADGYKLPINHAMQPYVYLGFLPRDAAVLRPRFSTANPTQGYNAGGQDVTFANCDLNPNSYIAFFGNDDNIAENNYHERCCDSPRMRVWYENDKPVPPNRYINQPDDYFFFYEMHMGGCGGYFTSSHGIKYNVEGATLGLGFDIKPRC